MRGLFLSILVLGALLMGCISTEITHSQHADGSADITQTTDLSILQTGGNSSVYGDALAKALGGLCEKYEGNVTCTEEDGIIKLRKHFRPSEAFYKFEVKDDIFTKRYRLTVDRIESLGSYSDDSLSSNASSSYTSPYGSTLGDYGELGKDDITLSGSRAKLMGSLLEQMKMEYTYTIIMPGSIKEAEGAVSFNDSEAEFDLIKQMKERKPIVVVSEEVNWPLVIISGVIGFMGLVLVILALMLLFKPKQV